MDQSKPHGWCGAQFFWALPAAKNLKSPAPGGPSMSNFPVNAPGGMGQDPNQAPPTPREALVMTKIVPLSSVILPPNFNQYRRNPVIYKIIIRVD